MIGNGVSNHGIAFEISREDVKKALMKINNNKAATWLAQ